ncbi:hypothetical protein [Gimesia aquarii]|uniref:hypothetical protein n=1 Tax=Gimesia aquarii TaxID=2527964 RepID=UPI0018D646A9|nr:hypothetical protein [Gimesia aquarii]
MRAWSDPRFGNGKDIIGREPDKNSPGDAVPKEPLPLALLYQQADHRTGLWL